MATDNEKTDEFAERLAAVEAEQARLKGADTRDEQLMKVAIRDPIPSPQVRAQIARQFAAVQARRDAVEARAEEHRQQAIRDAPKQLKRNREVAALEEKYRGHAAAVEREQQGANEAWAAIVALRAKPLSREAAALPPIFPPGIPIRVEDDPSDRRRWRLGGGR
jgi:hypothetical protein